MKKILARSVPARRKVLAWHFLAERKLPHGDNRPVEKGKTLEVPLPIKICERGLHGSRNIMDALGFSPGPILCRTEHSGEIQEQADKLCSSKRKVLWIGDISTLLHEFACDEAERALNDRIKEGYKFPEACFAAIEAKRLWLKGKISDSKLDAAWSAAWSAAESAAWSAARSAARSAAESAAKSAAESAARSAAKSAAESAAWSAAESAAWSAGGKDSEIYEGPS